MSIVNFEEHTEDLTEVEMKYLTDVQLALELCLKDNCVPMKEYKFPMPMKQPEVVKQVNSHLIAKYGLFCAIQLTAPRLRKYFNYFRTNGIIPIIATSQGCYITTDKEEIKKQIISMEQRGRQIIKASEGLKKFLL